MLKNTFKTTAVMFGLLTLVGCGWFSGDKDLPTGKRLSVLTAPEDGRPMSRASSAVRVPQAYPNADWAQFGATPTHVNHNLQGTTGNPQQAWRASFGTGSSKRKLLMAAPIVYNKAVYVQDAEGTVSSYNLENGERLWKHKIKPEIKNEADSSANGVGLAAAENRIFALAGFGSVVALDAQTGEELWRQELRTPLRTAPALCRDKLLVQTLDNRLTVYKTDTGHEVWQYKIPAEDTVLAGGATPACDVQKDTVVAAFSNGEIEALNLSAGYPLWSASILNRMTVNSATEINALKAAPLMADDMVYALGHNDNLAAVNYRTGEKIWERRLGGVNMPWLADEALFVLTNTNDLLALDAKTGETLWTLPLLEEYSVKEKNNIWLFGPVMTDGYLLVAASNGKLYRVEAQNGRIVDQIETGYAFSSAPITAEGALVFVDADARVVVYK